MKTTRIITSAAYEEALAKVDGLMGQELSPDESVHFDHLVQSIEEYEATHFPILPPDPVSAVLFRMEQQGLKQKDLIPYFGDKAKVSKFLAGKLTLSQTMIKNLHQALGIPLESLMGIDQPKQEKQSPALEWGRFPVDEMARRGWIPFSGRKRLTPDAYESVLHEAYPFLTQIDPQPLYLRSTNTQTRHPDPYAVFAWQLQVRKLAMAGRLKEKFDFSVLTPEFGRELAKLSYLQQGPLLAKEFLNKSGIHLIILDHLPKTYLDGAAMMLTSKQPVIGLTLRLDRLDNFWFNLFHELAHISLHLSKNSELYFAENLESISQEPEEIEANRWAAENLIPEELWRAVGFNASTSDAMILSFSKAIRLNPSIPAGRIRHESGNYSLYTKLLGKGLVRPLFQQAELTRAHA